MNNTYRSDTIYYYRTMITHCMCLYLILSHDQLQSIIISKLGQHLTIYDCMISILLTTIAKLIGTILHIIQTFNDYGLYHAHTLI